MDTIFMLLAVIITNSFPTKAAGDDADKILNEKLSHLNLISKVTRLLQDQDMLLLDSSSEIQNTTKNLALLGAVSDTINRMCSPREQRVIQSYIIENIDVKGVFSMYIAVNSLLSGDEYFYLEGVMTDDSLKAEISYHRVIDKPVYMELLNSQKNTVLSNNNWKKTLNATIYNKKVLLDDQFRQYSVNFNNGSNDIKELITQCQTTQCDDGKQGVCGRGQVMMDQWVNSTIVFQKSLAADVPLNYAQWMGSHNSFNNRADGYGGDNFLLAKLINAVSKGQWDIVWAQQYFSITDQLNMGIRYLMFDPVYFWGKMRLCHCSGVRFKWADKALESIAKVLHVKLSFDSGDLGCLPTDRPLVTAIQEIRDWLEVPGHQSEVVLIMLNDIQSDFDWGHKTLIWDPIISIFGELLFTQTDRRKHFSNSNSWPTPNQLLSLGKQVLVLGTSRIVNDSVFPDVSVPPWDKDTVKYFTSYPKCGGYREGQWYTVGGESMVVGQIYNGPAEEGLITSENFPYILQCPVSITKLDLVSPKLLQAAVWSWKEGYSTANLTNGQCAVMMKGQHGRWTTVHCDSKLCYHACCTKYYQITLSNHQEKWNMPNCPNQFEFCVPFNGHQNWQLYTAMDQINTSSSDKSEPCVWIKVQ